MNKRERIGDYLFRRLADFGVRHIFGTADSSILDFYDLRKRLKAIEIISTCDEQGAGFAADAYARIAGLGVVCATSSVGALKIAIIAAQASAARSPVVIIHCAPDIKERQQESPSSPITAFGIQQQLINDYIVTATVIDSPATAQAEIDRVLSAAFRSKGPVYIELPPDRAFALCPPHHRILLEDERSDPAILKAAIGEAVSLINAAKRPVILAGVEICRFGLQEELGQLAEQMGIPVAATVSAKSVVADTEKFYMGTYKKKTGPDKIRSYLESSDCLLQLGTVPSDIICGHSAIKIDPAVSICATAGKICIKARNFGHILFQDFIRGLLNAPIVARKIKDIPRSRPPRPFYHGIAGKKITAANLFKQLNSFIGEKTLVISDVGDALSGASDLFLRHRAAFLSPASIDSSGFAVPGALGAQLASPNKRPLVLVGGESFHMTGMEISAIARYGLNPIIIVLNNQDYAPLRPLRQGHHPHHAVHPWHFSKIPSVIGAGIGFIAETEDELELALQTAEKNTESFTIIDVKLDKNRRSPGRTHIPEKIRGSSPRPPDR